MRTVCPQGHDSASSDFCDVCGTRISSSPPGRRHDREASRARTVRGWRWREPARAAGRPWPASSARRAASGFPPGGPLPPSATRRSVLPLPRPKRGRCPRRRRRPARHRPARPNRCSRRCPGPSRPFRPGAGRSRRLPRPARRRQLRPAARRSVCRRHLSRRTSPRWSLRWNRCSRRPPGARHQLRPRRPLRLRLRRLRRPQPGLSRRPGPSSVSRPPARGLSPADDPDTIPYQGHLDRAGCLGPRLLRQDAGSARGLGSAVEFPAHTSERRIRLVGKQMRIGRRSAARDLVPEIDLADRPVDPGISRLHAVLTSAPDGTWSIT